jgi:hypothetical protein
MAAEFRALVVMEVDAIGVVKPWQKAAAVAATQRDSDSFMVAIRGKKIMLVIDDVCLGDDGRGSIHLWPIYRLIYFILLLFGVVCD